MPPAPTADSVGAFGGSSPDRGYKASTRRHLIGLCALGIAAYAITLIATAPAAILGGGNLSQTGASGTIWNGKVGISGQAILHWQAAPLRSLMNLAPSADFQLETPDGVLKGDAIRHFSGRTILQNVEGPASATTLANMVSALPFTCTGPLRANFKQIGFGSGSPVIDGEAILGAGTCSLKSNGIGQNVGSLRISATPEGARTRIHITPVSQRRQILLDATLNANGQLDIGLTEQGASTLSFLALPPGVRTQLSL